MDNDKHLTFVFIFMMLVIACFIGEANGKALNDRFNSTPGSQVADAVQPAPHSSETR
ncbi:MAG: hypothetical protein ACOYXC_15685 [Candidatus Rifleibacteriota bacterium]